MNIGQSPKMAESQFIGGLLTEETDMRHPSLRNQPRNFGMPPSVAPHVLNEDLISRPTSAPPVVCAKIRNKINGADSLKVTHAFEAPQPVHTPQYDVDSAEAFRADPAYSKWYYSQNPRDPRLPPPIVRRMPPQFKFGICFFFSLGGA